MRRALQTASLTPLQSHRLPCLSLWSDVRRHFSAGSQVNSQKKFGKYSAKYVTEMAKREELSMKDHSKIDGLIEQREREWADQQEYDWLGWPVFLRRMVRYGKSKSHDPWDAIQAQYFYLTRNDVSADETYGPFGLNALHICAQYPYLSTMMEWLLEDGSIDPKEGNLLHFAVKNNNVESAAALLKDKRVDKDAQDKNGNTVLIVAAMKRQGKMVSLLMKHGCNKEIRNNKGQTAVMAARTKEFHDMAQLIK